MNSPPDTVLRPPDPDLLEDIGDFLESIDSWVLERQTELTGIPAPPFGESRRGRRMARFFEEVGLARVLEDGVGNVRGWIGCSDVPSGGEGQADVGGASGRPFIVSAHLDTVFPAGTDVSPRRENGLIRAPGIADDGRGLAALLALARVFRELEIPLSYPLLFVATVGEEGAGNLRGVRYLFGPEGVGGDVGGFVSLDGVGLERIVTAGVGSRRLRLTIRGPGGHSWTDWGDPNPLHLLGGIISRAREIPLPTQPRTTLTFARCGGGTSINALPREAWAEVDLRSEKEEELEEVERGVLAVARGEVRRNGGGVELDVVELGHRPAGGTAASSHLVRAAREATRLLGVEPLLVSSSTDANLPMALGIPAITMGAGGEAGGIHTADEWYRNRNGPAGILRAALTLLLL